METNIRVGCSGFQKSHQVYYENFDTIEIQQTFYKPPKIETAMRWRQEAPAGFVFAIKAWQVITHEPSSPTYKRSKIKIAPGEWKEYGAFKPSQIVHDAWLTTRAIAEALKSEVILFQCPAQFTPISEHVANLRGFIRSIDRGDFLLAWEPRGIWPDELVKKLCDDLNLIHAVDPFLNQTQTLGTAYYRMHGGKDYSHQYMDDELRQLEGMSRGFTKRYCFFNNITMWDDGLRFKKLLEE